MKKTTLIIPAIVVVVLGAFSSMFIVDERQNALVLQFGRVVAVKDQPGLAFKIPLIQEVVKYDDRILSRDIDPLEVTPLDDRRLVVDAFARYRINDVRQFRQANGTGGIPAAEARLDSILRSQTREVLGSVSSNDILSSDRAALMQRIRNASYDEAMSLGLEVIDVRLKRTDLPKENLDATFARMRAEREREAADQVARGNERAQELRAEADRKQTETVSEAQRKSEVIRGEADARRNAVFAAAFGADEEFFEFYRSLNAYRKALKGSNSTMVISPDSEFFNYLRSNNPGNASPAPFDPASLGDDAALLDEGNAPEGDVLGNDAADADEMAPVTSETAADDAAADAETQETAPRSDAAGASLVPGNADGSVSAPADAPADQ
ncbi:protease modulator HflC [Pseudooceanicola sediminis]|uniref:Protease modulator HflC n=1 Tax=Pseudooceanicola sediminis TaxID=2211117 RepID=A0A399IUW6_9RHOB|nr:protease modulator HflC [Pseudooceanicola sediminis]KAA2311477.1 protease modulator HflC [Puniceibacterium sp. HSS470]RII36893.1 protease modulator HflC [Pseudooceanicola sediminis]|tara:strand:+ start:7202 stop:8344 length:1143 start_codon:yes stop_codon:yes gene_type:complete